MSLIIDGYNLLNVVGAFGSGKGPGGLQRAREAMLNLLVESIPPEELPRTIVVFDASESPWGTPRSVDHKGLSVRFAARDADADTLIEELIKADSAPRRLTVVSSDHRLQRAANRRKATAVDSDVWFAQLMRDRRERPENRPTPSLKPEGPFSQGEVEFWLKQFAEDDNQTEVAQKRQSDSLADAVKIVEADLSRPDHQQAIVALTHAYARDPMGIGGPLPDEAIARLIPGLKRLPTTLIFLAYLDGEAVGIATCFRGFSTFHAKPLINIHDLAVLPSHRGRGIGRKLLARAEQAARKSGCCKLTMEVAQGNPAKRLYEDFGFTQPVYGAGGGTLFYTKTL
jgi:GNAT superfamily N-acetyltransferase/predicted RNA-binding protein with PIN domain